MNKSKTSVFARWQSGLLAAVTMGMLSFPVTAEEKNQEVNLRAAEALIDAFYSFDSTKLQAALAFAKSSIPFIGFYQSWAQGGNYKIITRMPCENKEPSLVNCSITVRDDLMLALGIDFNVTDTFHVTFSDGKIVSVKTTSNDLPVFNDAMEWVNKEQPKLVQEPCRGFFEGGPTPGACVRAMVEGYRRFVASDKFPEKYKNKK